MPRERRKLVFSTGGDTPPQSRECTQQTLVRLRVFDVHQRRSEGMRSNQEGWREVRGAFWYWQGWSFLVDRIPYLRHGRHWKVSKSCLCLTALRSQYTIGGGGTVTTESRIEIRLSGGRAFNMVRPRVQIRAPVDMYLHQETQPTCGAR